MSAVVDARQGLADDDLERIAGVLAGGGLVLLPTETVYGVAASVARPEAVGRINEVKERPEGTPLQVLVADAAAARELAAGWPPGAERLARRFWPGPLTLVVPAAAGLPAAVTGPGATVGLRCPDHALALRILRRCGPLAASSANRGGQPPAVDLPAALAALGERVELAVDGGPAPGGVASSVVRVGGAMELLREGALSRGELEDAIREG